MDSGPVHLAQRAAVAVVPIDRLVSSRLILSIFCRAPPRV
jgi:hypothetical protein